VWDGTWRIPAGGNVLTAAAKCGAALSTSKGTGAGTKQKRKDGGQGGGKEAKERPTVRKRYSARLNVGLKNGPVDRGAKQMMSESNNFLGEGRIVAW